MPRLMRRLQTSWLTFEGIQKPSPLDEPSLAEIEDAMMQNPAVTDKIRANFRIDNSPA